jgi:hypothetical protein
VAHSIDDRSHPIRLLGPIFCALKASLMTARRRRRRRRHLPALAALSPALPTLWCPLPRRRRHRHHLLHAAAPPLLMKSSTNINPVNSAPSSPSNPPPTTPPHPTTSTPPSSSKTTTLACPKSVAAKHANGCTNFVTTSNSIER